MKKISSILILLIIALVAVSAASLPEDVLSVRAVGDFRKMTTEYSSSEYSNDVNTLKGVGFAFDYDYFINSFVGAYTSVSVVVPVKSDINGTTQSFDDSDFPVSVQLGFVGRVPFASKAGLDLRMGFGIVYDKSTPYGYTVYRDGRYTYILTQSYLSKIETQLTAGVGVYGYFDPDGNFGLRAGVNVAYTFYTGLYIDDRYATINIGDYKRTGYDIMPYLGFTFGF